MEEFIKNLFALAPAMVDGHACNTGAVLAPYWDGGSFVMSVGLHVRTVIYFVGLVFNVVFRRRLVC